MSDVCLSTAKRTIIDSNRNPHCASGQNDEEDGDKMNQLEPKIRGSDVVHLHPTAYSVYPSLQQWLQFPYPQKYQRQFQLGFDLGK